MDPSEPGKVCMTYDEVHAQDPDGLLDRLFTPGGIGMMMNKDACQKMKVLSENVRFQCVVSVNGPCDQEKGCEATVGYCEPARCK